MMADIILGIGSALWLGVLTSINPCPMATNVAAVSFIAKNVKHPRSVFFHGLAYTSGRMFSYGALGLVIIWSVFKVPVLANFLQKYMNRAIGPLLILTGIFLLDIIKLGFTTFSIPVDAQKRLAGGGVAGAFILGMLFALVFCPVSAALFFGSLITLAMGNKAGALLPLVYGLGTGIPVLIFAVLIAAGVSSLTRWFDRLRGIELYMRKATGAVFILVGSYYVSVYILK